MTTTAFSYSKDVNVADEQARFMTKVYGWMTIALVITGLAAMYTVSSPALLGIIFSHKYVFMGLIVGELILVSSLISVVQKIKSQTAILLFVLYSILNGITLSSVFLIYAQGSIASTFYITAGTFGAMSIYGYTTKSDLTKWGNLLFMGLIGVIIASVVNMFFYSEAIYWATTYIGVLVFVGLTAYDTQKIKNMYAIGGQETDENQKGAIMGALTLYLDFINLFLLLLRIFGRRK